MIEIAGNWIESEYITIDESGWHCAADAPEDIKKAFYDFMSKVNSGVKVTDPEE